MEVGKKKYSPFLKINKFVVWRRYNDKGIIVHTRKAEMFIVNDTGIRIIELINKKKELREIVNILCMEYSGKKESIKKSVENFINNMRRKGVIDG